MKTDYTFHVASLTDEARNRIAFELRNPEAGVHTCARTPGKVRLICEQDDLADLISRAETLILEAHAEIATVCAEAKANTPKAGERFSHYVGRTMRDYCVAEIHGGPNYAEAFFDMRRRGFDGWLYMAVSEPRGRQRKAFKSLFMRNATTGEFVLL